MNCLGAPRCLHFIPAPSLARFADKIPDIDADGFVFDINTSVCSPSDTATRENLSNFLRQNRPEREVVVRISSPRTESFLNDLDYSLSLCPDTLFVSKLESEDEMRFLADKLSQAETRCGRPLSLFVSIESLRGHNRRDSILTAVDCLSLYVVGYEDLSSYMGIVRPSLFESSPLRTVVENSIRSAHQAGVPIVDSVSFMYRPGELDEFRAEVECGKEIGLCGKLSVHPAQVSVINQVYDRPYRPRVGKIKTSRHEAQAAGQGSPLSL